jgi:hypothetical protein
MNLAKPPCLALKKAASRCSRAIVSFRRTCNSTAASRVIVNVSNENQPPTAVAGSDQTVNEGALVTLDGSSSSDPDGTFASCRWSQTAGPNVTLSDPNSAQPTFAAPVVGTGGASLTFQLTSTDDGGLQARDAVIVNVSNVNQTPIAEGGLTISAEEGKTVTLDGTGSRDPDGMIASWLWEPLSGPAVRLSDPRASKPTLVAPAVGSHARRAGARR